METPVNAPFTEKVRIEFKKLKEMSFKDKVEYIWGYYKFYIISFIVILAVTASLLYSRVINPAPTTVLFISLNGGFATVEQITDLTTALEKRLIYEDANEEVIISQMLIRGGDMTAAMMNNTRITAMIAAGQLDVFLNDFEMLEVHSLNGFLRAMEEGMLINLNAMNPAAFKQIEDNFVYISHDFDDGTSIEYLAGVNIGKSPLLTGLGFFEQDLIFSIAVTTRNLETVLRALITFFD